MALVTVFTDASYCPQTQIGGWGAWYKGDDMKAGQLVGGHIRYAGSSNEAELKAIVNALKILTEINVIKPTDAVMLQSDSEWALQCSLTLVGVRQKAKEHVIPPLRNEFTPNAATKDLLVNLEEIIRMNGLRLFVRHVKGHQGPGSTGRGWVNEACNAVALKHMRKLRSKNTPRRKKGGVRGHSTVLSSS